MPTPPTPSPLIEDPGTLTDFIMFSQREFLLALSKNLVKRKILFSQFYLLSHIATSSEIRMTDVANKMGRLNRDATDTVDKIQKLELLERYRCLTDRRVIMVRITPKGADLVDEIRSILMALIAKAKGDDK